ncbi:MAG: alpha/beta hydrolase-fold protein, partial [Fibrobacterota bacterium]
MLNAFTSEPFWEASNGFKAEKLYFESVNHPGGDNDFRPEVIIILPPEYFQNIDMRFPVIYRLHGQLSFPKEDCGEGGPWHTDLAYLSNKLNRPFILVAPDGDMNDRGNSFYRGSDGYSFEKYFSEELIDSIDANFRTIPRRTARVVSGYSMGGYGSIHLAQTFPDLLGVSLTYAALTMNMHYVRARNFFSVPLLMNEFQGAMLYSSNVKFDTVLTNRSVPHHSFFPEGGISGGHTSCIPGCGTPREQSLVFIDTMLDKIRNTPFSWQHTRLKPYDHPSNTPDTIFIFGNRFIVSQSRYEKKSDTEANLEHFASLRIYSFEKERIHTGLLERKDLNDYDMKWDDSLSYETVDILTAPYYSAGSEFTIVDSNITSGISKSYNITADEEKRLEFSLNGEEHIISISGEFVNPEVSPLSPGPLTLIKNCSKAVTFSWNTDIREAS